MALVPTTPILFLLKELGSLDCGMRDINTNLSKDEIFDIFNRKRAYIVKRTMDNFSIRPNWYLTVTAVVVN